MTTAELTNGALDRKDAEIARLRAELAGQKAEQKYLMGLAAADAEALRAELAQERSSREKWNECALTLERKCGDLRAEVAAEREKAHYANGVADLAIKHRDVAEAAARQDAEEPTKYMLWAEIRLRDGKIRQDAEEKARLKDALKPFAQLAEAIECTSDHTYDDGDHWEIEIGALRQASAALGARPQPARNRPLPETRCDCCDNGLDDAWEFCPFCGQQHPDATADAGRPQGEVHIPAHGPFPGAPFSPQKGDK